MWDGWEAWLPSYDFHTDRFRQESGWQVGQLSSGEGKLGMWSKYTEASLPLRSGLKERSLNGISKVCHSTVLSSTSSHQSQAAYVD